MTHYALYRCGGSCPVVLSGDTLRQVIETHAHYLARHLQLGSAAGTHLVGIRVMPYDVSAKQIPVQITCQGLPTVGGVAGCPKTKTAWILGPDPGDITGLVWDLGELTPADPEHYYDICHPNHPRYVGV